jgi:hypothetical protein
MQTESRERIEDHMDCSACNAAFVCCDLIVGSPPNSEARVIAEFCSQIKEVQSAIVEGKTADQLHPFVCVRSPDSGTFSAADGRISRGRGDEGDQNDQLFNGHFDHRHDISICPSEDAHRGGLGTQPSLCFRIHQAEAELGFPVFNCFEKRLNFA